MSHSLIPTEVFSQWFEGHPRAADRWKWIHPCNCTYELETWSIDQIVECRTGETKLMNWFRGKLKRDPISERFHSLVTYFDGHGTWPKPPLILSCDTLSGKQFPKEWEHGFPYVVVEGHHRLAVWLAYLSKAKLKKEHSVWIVSSRG